MRRLFLTLLVLCCAFTVNAYGLYQFKNVDVKNGLSDNYVREITRDSYGFMWFATINGLSRYDGYVFKNYTLRGQGTNNDFFHVQESADKTLWVCSTNKVYTYDRKSDSIADNAKVVFSKIGINEDVRRVYVDDMKNLWVIASHSLYHYNFKEKKLSSTSMQGKESIVDITSRQGLTMLITSDGNIYRADPNNGKLQLENNTEISSYTRYVHAYLDTKQQLWIYTSHSSAQRPKCYSTTDHMWVENAMTKLLDNWVITSMIDDSDGNLWVGTENEGAYICQIMPPVSSQRIDAFSSLGSHINCFYLDNDNTMWLGSAKLGVAYTNLGNTLFRMVSTGDYEDVSCITEDDSGNLWIGFDGGGVAMKSSQGAVTVYNKQNGKIMSDIVTCMTFDSKQRLWVGTYGEGVALMQNGAFRKVETTGKTDNRKNYVKCITADDDGNIWYGTIDVGLMRLREDGSTMVFGPDNTELKSSSVLSLATDKSNSLYVGTSDGFHVYDLKKQKFVTTKELTEKVGREYITSILVDSRNFVWIGTRNGIWVYRPQNNELTNITEKDGLSNTYIRSIVEDKYNNVWISTDNGITCITYLQSSDNSFTCTPFFDEDGLRQASFFNDASCATHDGKCLIGSFKGYLEINPKHGLSCDNNREVVFTTLYIKGKEETVNGENGILRENIQLTRRIEVPYNTNFSLTVSAMNHTLTQKIKYAYRIKGQGEEWNIAPDNNIYFFSMPSGEHQLEVKAITPGNDNGKISTLTIVIPPPFWRSTWAQLLYAALLAGGIALYVLRLKKKQAEKMEREKEKLKITQQYEMEENKIRFFTNISHDLKTPLTLIIAPLEKVLGESHDKSIKKELEVAWRNAKILLDEITQLLDFRKIDVGAEKLHTFHGDMVPFLQKTVQGFSQYAQSKNITLNTKINVSSMEMDFDENKMRRIIMNLLSNAYKYNRQNGTVEVTLSRQTLNGKEQMVMQVADTGIGISNKNKKHIFDRFYQEKAEEDSEYIGSGIGLHIVKEYVELHNGEISVKDNHPQGTVFTVVIPITSTAASAVAALKSEENVEDVNVDQPKEEQDTTPTILIVEDNEDSRLFLQRSLSAEYNIIMAENGKEALEMMKERDVNLVVTDIMMPVMNGLELCSRIKNDILFSHIPVIMLTAKSTEENIVAGLKDGVDEYITKPYSLNILKLRIKKILQWSEDNHKQIAHGIAIEPSKITVSSLDQDLITKAIQEVEKNMQDPDFSVVQLSQAVGMTRGHLYKKLMAITGKSPIEFMRIIKLKRGHSLLEQGKTNISEVAFLVGYSSKQFSRYFKEEYGCLPSEFLRKNKE